jgi:hypothetical protein
MVSTPDQQYANAPAITLTGSGVGEGEDAAEPVTSPGTPRIFGPETIGAGDPAPSFEIKTAGAPYFVVEVATEARLLDGAIEDGQRRPENFYATWRGQRAADGLDLGPAGVRLVATATEREAVLPGRHDDQRVRMGELPALHERFGRGKRSLDRGHREPSS